MKITVGSRYDLERLVGDYWVCVGLTPNGRFIVEHKNGNV